MLYFNVLRDKQIQIKGTLSLELVDAHMKNYRFLKKKFQELNNCLLAYNSKM